MRPDRRTLRARWIAGAREEGEVAWRDWFASIAVTLVLFVVLLVPAVYAHLVPVSLVLFLPVATILLRLTLRLLLRLNVSFRKS